MRIANLVNICKYVQFAHSGKKSTRNLWVVVCFHEWMAKRSKRKVCLNKWTKAKKPDVFPLCKINSGLHRSQPGATRFESWKTIHPNDCQMPYFSLFHFSFLMSLRNKFCFISIPLKKRNFFYLWKFERKFSFQHTTKYTFNPWIWTYSQYNHILCEWQPITLDEILFVRLGLYLSSLWAKSCYIEFFNVLRSPQNNQKCLCAQANNWKILSKRYDSSRTETRGIYNQKIIFHRFTRKRRRKEDNKDIILRVQTYSSL